MKIRRLTTALLAAFLVLSPASAALAAPATTYLYVGPNGSDANYGNRADKPLATLTGAEARLLSSAPTGPVEIRLIAGVYDDWVQRFGYSNGYPITIRGYGGTAIFDGAGNLNWGLRIHPRTVGTDMNLTVSNVAVRNATNGLQVRDAKNVRFVNFKANSIGNLKSPGGMGYAALSVYNSDNVTVENPTFSLIENDAASLANVHAIYAVSSENLVVQGGTYTSVSGDPIRLRNGSHHSRVYGGVFKEAGRYALLSDWRNPATNEIWSQDGLLSSPMFVSAYKASSLRVGLVACFDGASNDVENTTIRVTY